LTADDIHSDPIQEAIRVLGRAEADEIVIRAAGGVAVALLCPSARRPPLARSYEDVDFVVAKGHSRRVGDLFQALGYAPDQELNALQGGERLHFIAPGDGRVADVFVDSIRGCHEIVLKDRLGVHDRTVPPVDLVFSKLQIRETNRKDELDLVALFTDLELSEDDSGISVTRAAQLVRSDWGLWRTVTEVLGKTTEFAATVDGGQPAAARMGEFAEVLEAAPKSRRWRARSRVGDRVRWYEEPEEMES
jgi:hypothetical protein